MNRRNILKGIVGLGAGFGLLPGIAQSSIPTGRRLILVELSGANDGLNTLVPYRLDTYHRLRPSLSLNKQDVTVLQGDMAMHNALSPLMKHWDNNDLAWVQGLGYPTPNRSHFKSIALWESAGDGKSDVQSSGWMTHAMEHGLRREVIAAHGISVGGDLNLFNSDSGRWLSVDSASQFAKMSVPASNSSDYSDQQLGSGARGNLQLVTGQANLLDRMLSEIKAKLDGQAPIRGFSDHGFAQQLQTVAKLISAGVDTPVYRVRLDGFDTHDGQLQRHTRLLKVLGRTLDAMAGALKQMGEWDNTIIMTYSEFGRRAAENNSGGTDHGTAAPHLLLGGGVTAGRPRFIKVG